MNKRTLHRMFSVLMALVMAVSLLTGCGTKSAEQVQEQEDAQTIQVYLWTTSLYENYAPYIQAQLPDVNIEFIVGNNDLDFYKFLQQNGGLPDIITCCRFSLHDAAPLKDSLMNLAMTNEAGAVETAMKSSILAEEGEDEDEKAMVGKLALVNEAKKYLAEEKGREATVQELVAYTQLTEEELSDILLLIQKADQKDK